MHTYIPIYITLYISIHIHSNYISFPGQAKGYPKQSMDFLWTCKFKWYFGSSGLFTQLYVLLHHFYRYRIIEAVSMVPNPKVSCCFSESDHMKRKTQSIHEYADMISNFHVLPVGCHFDGETSNTINYHHRHLLWCIVQWLSNWYRRLFIRCHCILCVEVYLLYTICIVYTASIIATNFLFFQGSRLELPVCDADPPYICTGTCMGMGISAPHFWQFMG